MRHRIKGRTLGRNASHRHAMFRNMAASFIRTLRPGDDDPNKPKVQGRIITTVAKAKELRPFIEKLVTIARKAAVYEQQAVAFATTAKRNSTEWKTWKESDQYQKWNQAIAPAVRSRRKAFALLRDKLAVQILFDELAKRFESRDGGYTRIVRITDRRLGDGGSQALIEFVGVHDRVRQRRARTAPAAAPAVVPSATPAALEQPAS
ncbi:MAG: 50S ribosomal protein L17 [Planctomycetia bacterium]|nr:50S ribosomal protein L17 [Planctomycetia bacterium]